MQQFAWLLLMACSFTAVACLAFVVTYTTRAAGFRDPLGRTLLAIKGGLLGVSLLLSANVLIGIDGMLVRVLFSLLMFQIGSAVFWQTYVILKVNRRSEDRGRKRTEYR